MDEERGWGEIMLAAGLQGVVYALVKTAIDRSAAEWTRKATGVWFPGGKLPDPDAATAQRQPKATAREAK